MTRPEDASAPAPDPEEVPPTLVDRVGGAMGLEAARVSLPPPGGSEDQTTMLQGRSPAPREADRTDELGRYPIAGRLGAGGMGEILLVRDEEFGRELAAKVLKGHNRDDPVAVEKFLREAQITGQLEHPNIIPVHELGTTGDGRDLFFTMKRVQGCDLSQTLARMRQSDRSGQRLTQLLEVFLKVCDGVAFAHSRGVVHRDLKPSNIMVGQFGEVQVMDWGLANVIGQRDPAQGDVTLDLRRGMSRTEMLSADEAAGYEPLRTMDGDVMGTPAYMPPEQARGEIDRLDARSDIYSLGAILYEILTLKAPYTGNPYRIIASVVDGNALVPPTERAPEREIPWELEAVVGRAMAPDQSDRYATVGALKADIEAYLEGRILTAASYTTLQRVAKWVGRNKAASLAVLAVVVVGIGLAATFHLKAQRERAAALADAERSVMDELQALRGQRERREAGVAAVLAPDAPPLREPNGELSHAAVDAWYEAHTALAEVLDQLVALDHRAPSLDTRQAIGRPEIDARRKALCLSIAGQAARLGDDVMAKTWIRRARGAGLLSSDEASTELARIDAVRQQRVDEIIARARGLLAGVRNDTGTRDPFQVVLMQLVRLRCPALVRMLLDRRHLDSRIEWERFLAFTALGQIGDTQTRGEEGLNAVEALVARLQTCDLSRDLSTGVCLARALGDLRHESAYKTLLRRRWEAGMHSRFWRFTNAAIAQIPMPASVREMTPSDLVKQAEELMRRGDLPGALGVVERLIQEKEDPEAYNMRGLIQVNRKRMKAARADFDRAIELKSTYQPAYVNRAFVRDGQGDVTGALADLDRAIALDPNDPIPRVTRGTIRARQRQDQAALDDFAKAIELRPGNADGFIQRGNLHLRRGRPADAVEDYNQALRRHESHGLALINRAVAYRRLGRFDEAINDYTSALTVPGIPRSKAYNGRAAARIGQRDLAGALIDVERALRINPRFSEAVLNRAIVREQQGDLTAAERDYGLAIELDPGNLNAFYNRALMRLDARRWADALADLTRFIRERPRDSHAWLLRARANLEMGLLAAATKAIGVTLALQPGLAAGYTCRGRILMAQGKLTEALADHTRAVELDNRATRAFLERGRVRYAMADFRGAIVDFTHAIRLDPKSAEAYRERAVSRRVEKDFRGSMADFRKALGLDPKDGVAYFQRGNTRLLMGDLAGAENDFARVIELEPKNASAWTNRGLVRHRMGNLRGAVDDFEHAIKLEPKQWQAWVSLGVAQSQQRRNAEALESLERALDLAPEKNKPTVRRLIAQLKSGQ